MDDEGLLGSTVSIHRAVTGKPGLAAWEMTPLFNGNEVCKILPKLPRGPAIGEVIDAMVTVEEKKETPKVETKSEKPASEKK